MAIVSANCLGNVSGISGCTVVHLHKIEENTV